MSLTIINPFVFATGEGGGGDPVEFVAASYNANPGTTRDTVTVAKPTGTTDGDVMIASITYRGTGFTITEPSGWTLIRETTFGGASDPTVATYYKVAGGSEPSDYTWTLSLERYCTAGIVTLRGADTSTPITDSAGATDTTNNDPYPSASCGDGDAALFILAKDSGAALEAYVAPSTATIAYGPGATSFLDLGAAYELNQAAASTGERSPETTNSGDFVLQTIVVKVAS